MLKFYSIIIGENPAYTKTFQPGSKRKIALLANCLIIPVILWFINGYLLVHNVLDGSVGAAILTACIAGIIIFLIERAILMSNGSRRIFWFRIFLGFIVASLGSISMDEVIFEHDIDNKIAEYKRLKIEEAENKVQSGFEENILIQQGKVHEKEQSWKLSLKQAIGEADGTLGSKIPRRGKITDLKFEIANKLENDYKTEKTNLKLLETSFAEEKVLAAADAEANFKGSALLMRIRAMFDLIASDYVMLVVYILLTMFLFCIEFLVVIVKIESKDSIDEEIEKARDQLSRMKITKIIARSDNSFRPEQFDPSVREANSLLKQNETSIIRY